MEAMPRPRPPYLSREVTRHGRAVWYVRRGGNRIRLKADYGTLEFDAEYQAALTNTPQTPKKGDPAAGTLGWLVARYRETGVWQGLSLATRRQRENILKRVLATAGDKPVARITTEVIAAGRDRRNKTPFQARHFLDTMRGLFRWAAKAKMIRFDPTVGVEDPSMPKTEGFPVWTEDHVAAYEKRWPIGTRQRVWLDVLLYTGLRRGDVVRFGRQHIRDGVGTIKTEKTGTEVTLPADTRRDLGRRVLRRPRLHRQQERSAVHQGIIRQCVQGCLPRGRRSSISAWLAQDRGNARSECWGDRKRVGSDLRLDRWSHGFALHQVR